MAITSNFLINLISEIKKLIGSFKWKLSNFLHSNPILFTITYNDLKYDYYRLATIPLDEYEESKRKVQINKLNNNKLHYNPHLLIKRNHKT